MEEDLEDTLPNASTDDATSIQLNDSMFSLPDASTDHDGDTMPEASLEEDISLPDASLDISVSSSVDPELGKGYFVQKYTFRDTHRLR